MTLVLKMFTVFTIILCAQLKSFGTRAAPSSSSCTAAEYHQFDFWVGDWDVFDFDNLKTPVAHVRVDQILTGCVLREDYQDTTGHQGQSFSLYDASRKLWHQTWVTNRGELLLLDGKLEGNQMVLAGTDLVAGKERQVRGVWKPASEGVRETAVRSLDGGKRWQPWFDLLFRPHKP